jgi:GNAT superfamily N-acetyltransferase
MYNIINKDCKIIKADLSDFTMVCWLFDEAIKFQKSNNYVGWEKYDIQFILKDIQEGNLFKLINEQQVVAIFSICFTDNLIWKELDNNKSLYVHRVITNPNFRGNNSFSYVLEWLVNYAKSKSLNAIRMDTWFDNPRLIQLYKTYGFVQIRDYVTENSDALPIQHRNLHVSLLELIISNIT